MDHARAARRCSTTAAARRAWLTILAALAQAQADVGLVPAEAAALIAEHATIDRLDLAVVAEGTRSSGHSTHGLIGQLREMLPEQAREWVYYGATVQDLSDTWFGWVLRTVGDVVERDLARCRRRHVSRSPAGTATR